MDQVIDLNNPFKKDKNILRYGENPHQQGFFYGNYNNIFEQLHGKELSYNNLVDVDAAIQLMHDLIDFYNDDILHFFAIIKHTNVCGIAGRKTVKAAWKEALAGDPESAFGGILICSGTIDKATAKSINELFFEVIIALDYDKDALDLLRSKKNRIILLQKKDAYNHLPLYQYKSVLNSVLVQQTYTNNFLELKQVGAKKASLKQLKDLVFANFLCKHLKSNSIALVKNMQLIGKGCGQTSRIDALRQAIQKAKQFKFDLTGAVLASDAFFPFDDCVKIAHKAGIMAFIQPGGSIRDNDSIQYCQQNNLVMILTGLRHFKH